MISRNQTVCRLPLAIFLIAFFVWAAAHLDKFAFDDDKLYTMCLALAFRVMGKTVSGARIVTILRMRDWK